MKTASPARAAVFPLILTLSLAVGALAGIGGYGYWTHGGKSSTLHALIDPRSQFPGRERINVLVMGIDDNWTEKDLMYTKNARTDTLFVVSLELSKRKGYLLSIPRDSYVPISGTKHSGKINGAYATGGPERARGTVEKFLGVPIDYYVVLKIDATKKLVDSIGGVDLNVEKDMDYDDNWGHLHIHFKKGPQHLDGDQAVSYIRFRHDREGDFGRMRRQQQLLHSIAQKLKTPQMFPQLSSIMETFQQAVATDFTQPQLLALAELFRGINPSEITTGYVPGEDERINGVWYLITDEPRKKLLVDWLLKGKESSEIPLVKVAVEDGCGNPAAAAAVQARLRAAGFQAYVEGDADRSDYPATQIIDFDRVKGAGSLVQSKLGLSVTPVVQPDPQADTSAIVIVGQDLAGAAVASRPAQT